ncbi:hypothetical protein VDBG_05548 [Verticillium alfalfae VaMs.102]|uniref:Uncharacterized protein n=1 Tax=Verticillium alfalfae (strain VaMs.102 / ATCC MYA-4576 / FGSC 10136) TaxID=526221 RepID=C9SL71_VERA1|nr:hypothetical protein VDBG_05548 [Verticillium alfalfae VaMs.102]EEY19439.1 hypothetical protein VDBG_05548 [Verticillium alfalfae VaMs.102]
MGLLLESEHVKLESADREQGGTLIIDLRRDGTISGRETNHEEDIAN